MERDWRFLRRVSYSEYTSLKTPTKGTRGWREGLPGRWCNDLRTCWEAGTQFRAAMRKNQTKDVSFPLKKFVLYLLFFLILERRKCKIEKKRKTTYFHFNIFTNFPPVSQKSFPRAWRLASQRIFKKYVRLDWVQSVDTEKRDMELGVRGCLAVVWKWPGPGSW